MKRFLYLFLLLTCASQAQYHIIGTVKDAETNQGLPFTNITSDSGTSEITDVDGKFHLSFKNQVKHLSVSYVGYETKKIELDKGNPLYITILLSPKSIDLNEIIISKVNPANEIIQKVIQNKAKNNPEKKLNSFEFKAYNKLIVTANPDSVSAKIDTLYVDSDVKNKISKIDSSAYKFKKIIEKQHLFISEKVSLYQFKTPTIKETILGAKMGGLKNPIYELLGFNLQSLSVYDENYELFETKYKSPVSKSAFGEYTYKLLDTTVIQDRKVDVIYFKNKHNRRGLEGLLYIDSKSFAIAKAIMRIRGILNLSGIHEFNYNEEQKLWFPTRKDFKIVKGSSKKPMVLLGGRIEFKPEDDSEQSSAEKRNSDFIYFLSTTHFYDLKINPFINIKNRFYSIDIKKEAANREESFWNKNRTDSLDLRSEQSYKALDSISQKNKIEKKLFVGRKLLLGYFPLKRFDMDLRSILSFNNHEGFRLGFGGKTNELFSKKYQLEGYGAYGIKDETFKYNIEVSLNLGTKSESWTGISFTDDIREIASTKFAIDKQIFKLYDPRPINISTFYNHKTWRGFIESKFVPKTESTWQLSRSEITPLFGYQFNLNGKLFNQFTLTTALVSVQWSPFSDFMQTPKGNLEYKKGFPKFTFQLTKSLPNFLGNDFDFGKIDFRIDYEKAYLNGQRSAILIQGGYGTGDIPITHLYNSSPNNITKSKILQRVTIAGKNSFETMFFNEFFSSEYVYFQLKHGFQKIKISQKIKPTLVFVTRMGWGNLKNPEQHLEINYKTLNKGYFESGIELNKIYKGFGLTGFYRYGPNQLSKVEDNIAIKLSFILDFGF